jgi:hypothetical protein
VTGGTQLPGEHDGPRHGPARDVAGVRDRARHAARAHDGGARRRRGRGRRRPRAPVGGDGRRRAAGEPWRSAIDLRVEDSEHPLRELPPAALTFIAPTSSPTRPTSCWPPATRTGPASVTTQAQRLAPESDELLFWAGLARAHAGELDAGVDAVRRAGRDQPRLRLDAASSRLAAGVRPGGGPRCSSALRG